MASTRIEEYLEAIFKLEQDKSPVSITKLSKELKLSAASVSGMLKRLTENDLISPVTTKGIHLTKKGSKLAKKVVRRHRLSERLLTDFLKLPWDRAHDEACKLEHAISPEVEEQLAKSLGEPPTCPHGHPIPTKDGRIPKDTALALSKLKAGKKAVIISVSEESPKMLNYLATLGLIPDVQIQVMEVAPFGGPLLIKVHKAKYALGQEVAQNILVREIK